MHWRAGHRHSCQLAQISIESVETDTEHFTDSGQYYRYFGCCLDCVAEGVCKPITYFCDNCKHPFVCPRHEAAPGKKEFVGVAVK